MAIVELVAGVIRSVGAALGTPSGIQQRRVRLRVEPSVFFHVGSGVESVPGGLSTAVVNLSAFEVTVAEAGPETSGGQRIALPMAPTTRGTPLPVRLRSREQVSILWPLPVIDPVATRHAVCGYARTDCGYFGRGRSHSFGQFVDLSGQIVRERAVAG